MSLDAALERLGLGAELVVPIAGDASHRRYHRVLLQSGGSVVACVYPEGQEAQAARDAAVARWADAARLPVPRLLAFEGLVTVAEDLGEVDLDRALEGLGAAALEPALETLATFQNVGYDTLPTPPFDAGFFRRELAGFERYATASAALSGFCDELATSLGRHPYRLTHRDFHANNLFLLGDRAVAIDFQDMRGGPDTYDAASLLRERAAAALVGDEWQWTERIARRCEWPGGWRRRYLECAAQRGLKVIGTFRRLAAEGRPAYLRWLPDVRVRTLDALSRLGAPPAVALAVAEATRGKRV